jgi:hypothetical protein
MLVFLTQLCDLYILSPVVPLVFSLVQLSPPPISRVNKYTRIQCVRGEGMGLPRHRQINTCRKIPLQANFLR